MISTVLQELSRLLNKKNTLGGTFSMKRGNETKEKITVIEYQQKKVTTPRFK